MPKHEVKGVIHDYAPQCFSDAASPQDLRFTVTLDDSVVRLRKFGFRMQRHPIRGEAFSIDLLVNVVFGHVPGLLRRAKAYCAVFDKPSFVTLAKQPEQRQRDSKVQSVESEQAPEVWCGDTDFKTALDQCDQHKGKGTGRYGSVCLCAHEWDKAINTRESRNDIIRVLCHRASELLPLMLQQANVPEDHFVVLDFEGFAGESQLLPIVVTRDGVHSDRCSEFRNELGEFDVAAMHYVHLPAIHALVQADQASSPEESTCCLLIDSIDTDLVIISALNCDREVGAYVPPMRVRTTLTKPTREVYFDPSALADWVADILTPVPRDGRMPLFAEMYALAGSDFVPSQKGLSSGRAMRLFLDQQGQQSPFELMRANGGGKRSGGGGTWLDRLSGRVQASAADPTLEFRHKRADFSVNYWRHSAWRPESMYVSPLNHGFSLGTNAQMVYTEDLLDSAGVGSSKRHRLE